MAQWERWGIPLVCFGLIGVHHGTVLGGLPRVRGFQIVGNRKFILPELQDRPVTIRLSASTWESAKSGSTQQGPRLDYKPGGLWPSLPAMHGRFGTPLGRQPPNSLVHILVEAKQVADHAVVELTLPPKTVAVAKRVLQVK